MPAVSAQIPYDTLTADSLAQDTVDNTARFLAAQQQVAIRVPVMPWPGVTGPAPALTRIVFNRDSIEWANAATVGDLLLEVPGVYLWRGGFIGRPEPVNYQGRGATSVEYYLDGLPYVAAGVDSIAVDPALFSITLLDRVEVERWPGLLRVHLFTRRHDRLAPRSRVGVASGDRDFSRYDAALRAPHEVRHRLRPRGGLPELADLQRREQRLLQYPGLGAGQLRPFGQVRAAVPARPLASGPSAVRLGGRRQRHDRSGLRCHAHRRAVPPGPALPARRAGQLARPDLCADGLGRRRGGAADQPGRRVAGLSEHRGFSRRLGAAPDPVDLARSPRERGLDAGAADHGECRGGLPATTTATGRASTSSLAGGLQPVRGLALTATARLGDQVAAPSILADTAQKLRDFGATLGWERDRLAFEVGWARTAAFSPFRLRRVSPRGVPRAAARDRVAHGEGEDPSPPLDRLGGMVQRSQDRHAGRHPANALLRGGHHPLEVPAAVSQRDLRPQGSRQRGDLGRRRDRARRDRCADSASAERHSSGVWCSCSCSGS